MKKAARNNPGGPVGVRAEEFLLTRRRKDNRAATGFPAKTALSGATPAFLPRCAGWSYRSKPRQIAAAGMSAHIATPRASR
jgi:hypothetical protein